MNEHEKNNLLPCPFCGGEAYREVKHDILKVGCNNCLINFCNHVRFGCRADSEWNTRIKNNEVNLLALLQEIKDLKAEIQRRKDKESFDNAWNGY